MNKSIEIEEMRISSDGKYLEFIINCPDDYQFTDFIITPYGEDSQKADIFYNENGQYIRTEDNRFSGRIPVEDLGVEVPTLYSIKLTARHDDYILPKQYLKSEGYYIEEGVMYNKYGFKVYSTYLNINDESFRVDGNGKFTILILNVRNDIDEINIYIKGNSVKISKLDIFGRADITIDELEELGYAVDNEGNVKSISKNNIVSAISVDETEEELYLTQTCIISDVSHVYGCLTDDIFSIQAKCVDGETQDRVIKNYLILYAHQEAMRLGQFDEAKKLFDMMDNCFNGKCGKSKRSINCGCNKPKLNSYRGCKK